MHSTTQMLNTMPQIYAGSVPSNPSLLLSPPMTDLETGLSCFPPAHLLSCEARLRMLLQLSRMNNQSCLPKAFVRGDAVRSNVYAAHSPSERRRQERVRARAKLVSMKERKAQTWTTFLTMKKVNVMVALKSLASNLLCLELFSQRNRLPSRPFTCVGLSARSRSGADQKECTTRSTRSHPSQETSHQKSLVFLLGTMSLLSPLFPVWVALSLNRFPWVTPPSRLSYSSLPPLQSTKIGSNH